MTDLSTSYLGLRLSNPLVASSSSLTDSVDKLRVLQDAGVGAVVLKSIFEEQLVREAEQFEATLGQGAEQHPEVAGSYFANLEMGPGPADYAHLVENAKRALAIPVIASINCTRAQSWIEYAKTLESAGADALELNLYFVPVDPDRAGAAIEQDYFEVVEQVRARVKLPIAVKLSPFLTSIGYVVKQLSRRGADAVVLFNRFYQPNFDLDQLAMSYQLQLSRPEEALLPLRWIALLYGRVEAQFAASSGIHDGDTAIKMILAGASVVQMASALFKYKAGHLAAMLHDMRRWLSDHEYASVDDIRGLLSQPSNPEPEAFERAQYIKMLVGHD